jgi:hypothetical protein
VGPSLSVVTRSALCAPVVHQRRLTRNVNVLAVLGMPVGVDAAEHAGGLPDLDEVAVGVA